VFDDQKGLTRGGLRAYHLSDPEGSRHMLAQSLGEYGAAREEAAEADRIIVFGSFLTVAAVLAAKERAGPAGNVHDESPPTRA